MKFLLFISYIFFASGAWAECSPMPSCDELNFKDTSCQGDFITCPFDKTKKKCITCTSTESICKDYKLLTCPAHGRCENCPADSTYKKLTSCESKYHLNGNSCLPATCENKNFPNRKDLVIKAILEGRSNSTILEMYANLVKIWKSADGLVVTDPDVQIDVDLLVDYIYNTMNNIICYGAPELDVVDPYAYQNRPFSFVTQCCRVKDSSGYTICTRIGQYIKEHCLSREGVRLGLPIGACTSYKNQLSMIPAEMQGFAQDIDDVVNLCKQVIRNAGFQPE